MRISIFLSAILVFSSILSAQTEYVPPDDKVYDFLERMETLQIITDYNSFEIPKTRKDIAEYLVTVISSDKSLDEQDRKLLDDFKIEFEYDLYRTLEHSTGLIGGSNYNFFSQKQKYLYLYDDPGKINLFINITGEGDFLNKNDIKERKISSAFLGIIGGEIRGNILNKIGFYLKGTDGSVSGNRVAAYLKSDLRYNYKFNENPEETFFDETRGYISADFDLISFKFGRDRMNIGYGINKILLGNSAPIFDYLGMDIRYKFFSYSFFHGQLLGHEYYAQDTTTGGVHVVDSKYIAYHRIGFDFSRHIGFGAGEAVIYGERPLDFSYLNPFAFYKSIEHSNRDRDNAMLFFDLNNKSIKGLKFYATFLIDDIDFGKLGTGWWGNQTILDAGMDSELLYNILPLSIKLQYTKIDPYVYTHRLERNNFTNFGYSLSSFSEPNSELFLTYIKYRFNNRLLLSLKFNYKIHGANPLNSDGSLKENVGGDILLGHREYDSDKTEFLGGYKEYSRLFAIKWLYEPVNDYYLSLEINYLNETLQSVNNESFDSILTLSIKI